MPVTSDGLKNIESGGAFQKIATSTVSNLSGNKLLYTYADLTDTTRPYGNLFKSFNFPITNEERDEYFSKYENTALIEFLNSGSTPINKIIVVEIPKGEYGELIDGKTFKLKFPVTLNSVATSTTVYGTYFGFNPNLNKQLSENRDNPFGFKPTPTDSNTNVTFLYSNDLGDEYLPKDKGNEVVILTSTTFNLTTNDLEITAVTLNNGDIIKFDFSDLGSLNLNTNIRIIIGSQTYNPLEFSGFKQINIPSSQSPKIKLVGGATTGSAKIKITRQQQNNTLRWSEWSSTNKFPKLENDESGKAYAIYDSFKNSEGTQVSRPDKPVGILFQDKGFAVITNPTLVNNFRFTAGTSSGFNGIASGVSYNGDTNFAKIYFTDTNISSSQFESITTEFIQNIICIAGSGEFLATTNSTFQDAYDENTTEKPLFISTIGLYNAQKQLIAIGKLSEPVKKLPNTIIPFNIKLVV